MNLSLILGVILIAALLIRAWTGVLNAKSVERQSLATLERSHPFIPKGWIVLLTFAGTSILLVLSSRLSLEARFSLFGDYSAAMLRSVLVFALVIALGTYEQWRWKGAKERYRHLFAFVLGTAVTWILIGFKRAIFETGIHDDPFLLALGVTCIVIGWKFLFGPWSASIKATVLGTFIFWVAYAILRHETKAELIATGLATIIALIPVILWCALFLSYHTQRLSVVVLAFFAGMLSTTPILFYDQLTRLSTPLNFFLFTITPVQFSGSSSSFVSSLGLPGMATVSGSVAATLVTYLIVGCIEEGSKYWVLKRGCSGFFRSIDDAMQLAIIVAIGFAFAENLVNPHYFVGFVRTFILESATPHWGAFLANVFGRSVLTNMVHILSTGVLGYFFGRAYFAHPILNAHLQKGRTHAVIRRIHEMLDLPIETVYARSMLMLGILSAIVLHGIFDFIVTVPDILPGKPSTLGALIMPEGTSLLHAIPITLLPSLLYTVGGVWLLSILFERQEDMKDFGAKASVEAYIS